jgi:hypothetical protein
VRSEPFGMHPELFGRISEKITELRGEPEPTQQGRAFRLRDDRTARLTLYYDNGTGRACAGVADRGGRRRRHLEADRSRTRRLIMLVLTLVLAIAGPIITLLRQPTLTTRPDPGASTSGP